MAKSVEETRRSFLLRLARTAAFVPPAMATLPAAVGGGGGGRATGGGRGRAKAVAAPAAAVTGGLSPTAQLQTNTQFRLGSDRPQQPAPEPWRQRGATPPPWSKPPPTSTGG